MHVMSVTSKQQTSMGAYNANFLKYIRIQLAWPI